MASLSSQVVEREFVLTLTEPEMDALRALLEYEKTLTRDGLERPISFGFGYYEAIREAIQIWDTMVDES